MPMGRETIKRCLHVASFYIFYKSVLSSKGRSYRTRKCTKLYIFLQVWKKRPVVASCILSIKKMLAKCFGHRLFSRFCNLQVFMFASNTPRLSDSCQTKRSSRSNKALVITRKGDHILLEYKEQVPLTESNRNDLMPLSGIYSPNPHRAMQIVFAACNPKLEPHATLFSAFRAPTSVPTPSFLGRVCLALRPQRTFPLGASREAEEIGQGTPYDLQPPNLASHQIYMMRVLCLSLLIKLLYVEVVVA